MNKKLKKRRSTDGSSIISVISVTLMLIVTGITLTACLGAYKAAGTMRSGIGFVAVVEAADSCGTADSLARALSAEPFAESVTVSTAGQVMERWEKMMGPEDLLDINPFLPEVEVNVRSRWAKADSLDAIAARLEKLPCINHVQTHAEVASAINRTLSSTILLLAITALILLAISVALIANTVRLQLHSHRYIIHTQQYVGATAACITGPYVKKATLHGIIAAVAASAVLAAIRWYAVSLEPASAAVLTIPHLLICSCVLLVSGMALCAITARLTALKYINSSYEDIFS